MTTTPYRLLITFPIFLLGSLQTLAAVKQPLSLEKDEPTEASLRALTIHLENLPFSELVTQDTLISSLYELSKNQSDEAIHISALTFLGMNYFEKSDYKRAKATFEEIIFLGKKERDWKQIAKAHNYLSLIADFEGHLMDMYQHNKALLDYGKQFHPQWIAAVFLNLGVFYTKIKEYEKADQLYHKGLDIYQQIPKNVEYGWLLHRIGELKIKSGRAEEAIYYLLKAKKFAEDNNNDRSIAFTTLQFGQIALQLNQLAKARKYFDMVLAKAIANDYWMCQIKVYSALGYLNFKEKNYLKAIASFESAINYAITQNIPHICIDEYPLLAKAYTLTGQKAKANDTYETYVQQSQNARNRTRKMIAEWVKNEDALEKQKQAYGLLEQNTIYDKDQLLLQQKIILGTLLLLLTITWIAYVFFRMNKRVNSQKEELLALNRKIQEQTNQLTIANESIKEQKNELQVKLMKQLLVVSNLVETEKQLLNQIKDLPDNKDTLDLKKTISNVKNDSVWKELDVQITQTNMAFFEKLSKQYTNLSQGDLRLCALLKMNLRTKEIANLTFRNPESVKVARSRLRKKLGLTHSNIDLSAFLNQL